MLKVTASVAAVYGQPGIILGFSFNLTLKSIDLSICFHFVAAAWLQISLQDGQCGCDS